MNWWKSAQLDPKLYPLTGEQNELFPDETTQAPKTPEPTPFKPKKHGLVDLRLPLFSDDAFFVALGPGNDTLLYNYANGQNSMDIRETLNLGDQYVKAAGFGQDFNDILIAEHGKKAILNSSADEYSWGKTRSRYTPEITIWTKELLKRKIIMPQTKIIIGNWARRDGDEIGTAADIAQNNPNEQPKQIILYHGTIDLFLPNIMQVGLQPRDFEDRIWKDKGGRKGHPQHRDNAVYLTAVKEQAAYYAEKAVRVARRRGMGRAKPEVLEIVLNENDLKFLLADDDWLNLQKALKLPNSTRDWYRSLVEMGQIACVQTIPPNRIKPLGVITR